MSTGFDAAGWSKQVSSCEFLDSRIGTIFDFLHTVARGTIIVLCGDHGDCFGEDGLYGHGFYHPKVMEVPLGVLTINYTLPAADSTC